MKEQRSTARSCSAYFNKTQQGKGFQLKEGGSHSQYPKPLSLPSVKN